ncbi:trans-sulfuration enzyme family protein [Anaeromicropila populeti]|uniref:homocysteine desulfhydrase n=1 Tax=Anaeromicropila populeti TaxID=37658 RepID=A0A1I6IFI1_9FIRM|nr:aminotransferase class I/II-fold pyridoxal phosphate-dependent enzyme [Anaeromicropila populeti]SFR65502.1 cystathionine gamma-synthase [Anaeromicropila populeti]
MEFENYSEATRILYEGHTIKGMSMSPEAFPLFNTTAFNMGDLNDVDKTYEEKGYTYVRTRNPNREALAQLISFLENGKKTLIFSSGMGGITTTYFALLNPGDHFICNSYIYGETFDAINQLLKKCSVEVDFVDFTDLQSVRAAVKPNTKMLYTEVVSNPTDIVADIENLADIAHEAGAWLMVDNTFTTPLAVKPMELGADIVLNSLTKFMNGHSDALAGSITVDDCALYDRIHEIRMLTGTSASPHTAWTVFRGMQTVHLRVNKQMENAAKLAKALEEHPIVLKVNHPSIPSNPQHELAGRIFKDNTHMTGMLSFDMPDDKDKINAFMNRLKLARYAPTLGGIRTTLSHPLHSSHHHVPEEDRKKMGISYGTMRVSCGIEEGEDLIRDFMYALEVFQ